MSVTNLNETISNTSYKEIQMDFLKWAANWVRHEDKLQTSCVDLPDVVNLLQAMGYRITYVSKNESFSPLRGAQGGSRVVTTCSYSGQRCVLEHPAESENCKCLKVEKVNVPKDAFWEVVATTPKSRQSVIESGSDMIPTIGREKGKVIKHVMNYLIHMMKQTEFKELGSVPDLNMTPVTARGKGRVSDPCGILRQTTPLRNSFQLDSPARYRSLDTLTAKDADVGLPEPGNLIPKVAVQRPDIMVIQSSPNIKLAVDDGNSSTSTIGEVNFPSKAISLMRSASENLIKALNLIEMSKSPKAASSPSSVFEEKLLNASKNIKKFICTSKPSGSTSTLKTISSPNLSTKVVPKSRLPSRSTGSYTVTSRISKPPVRKVSASSAQQLPKCKDRYSHIKSTIPKADKKK